MVPHLFTIRLPCLLEPGSSSPLLCWGMAAHVARYLWWVGHLLVPCRSMWVSTNTTIGEDCPRRVGTRDPTLGLHMIVTTVTQVLFCDDQLEHPCPGLADALTPQAQRSCWVITWLPRSLTHIYKSFFILSTSVWPGGLPTYVWTLWSPLLNSWWNPAWICVHNSLLEFIWLFRQWFKAPESEIYFIRTECRMIKPTPQNCFSVTFQNLQSDFHTHLCVEWRSNRVLNFIKLVYFIHGATTNFSCE